MRCTGENGYELAFMKRRRDDGEVEQMPRAAPRIIGHINIARLHRVDRKNFQKFADRTRHGIDVARRACDRLRKQIAFGVENTRR